MLVEYRLIRLWADRVRMVRRHLASPRAWPDGIDSKYERWYLGQEGEWAALLKELDEHGDWKGGLDDEQAYARFFVTPTDVTKNSVTNSVTKANSVTNSVTKANSVTSAAAVTQADTAAPKRRGPPPTGQALTAAERKRRQRAKR